MQGVEDEDEGAYRKYVIESEFRKQRGSLRTFWTTPGFSARAGYHIPSNNDYV